MAPVGVAELDHVVAEDNFDGINECLGVVVGKGFVVDGVEVGRDAVDGWFGGDVCIH